MSREFVNLHAHTNLGSMLDALSYVDDLFNKADELGQKSLAITDHGTLACHYDAFQAYKRTGVKFIPGCEMYFVRSYDYLPLDENSKTKRRKTEKRKHIVLLAQNEIGYKNLLRINFEGFKHHVVVMGKVYPRINWEELEKYSEGIIITSACGGGILAEHIFNNEYDKAVETAMRLMKIFEDRFFIEIQPHGLKNSHVDQIFLNNQLINIAQKLGVNIVVCGDVHYITRESEKIHDVMLAINSKKAVDDPDRHRYGIDEFYVKSGDEVYEFLEKHHGKSIAELAVSNTVKIAEMCKLPDYMETTGNHLPIFDPSNEPDHDEFCKWSDITKISKDMALDVKYMRYKVIEGFKEKFSNMSAQDRKIRWERVKKELKILEGNNFSSYMLVTADFIKWAKNNDILVGIGRGSVGGCMIAYLLGIHGVDPIEYNLLFERFQNAYKTDLPDIDTDFTSAGRDAVQEYVREKYGRDHCAQVSNINTYTPKNVIPDLVKSMRNMMPNLIGEGEYYVKVADAIKATIPDVDADKKKVKTLERAMELSPDLNVFAKKCPELMEYADAIIGMPKEYSTHAAGMVVSDIPIVEFAPLRIDKNGGIAAQYEKNRCENIGLVKMDFLAISTLDIIDETFKNIRRLGITDGPKQMENIPLDDKNTYKMIQDGHTKCVFQLGKSSMMVSLCKKILPKNIIDIAVINALGRPSSKDERQEYIDRRFGVKDVSYIHHSLKNCLSQTYGLCIMEEQLMDVAKDVAGWDLNKADGLRKLTKWKGKDPKFALQLEVDFIEGMMKTHNAEYELSKEVWDKVVEKFSGYGFNLSHAVFYSINGYITAYLKCHYPAAFLAAYLKIKTSRGGINREDEINMAKMECRRIGVKIVPPDINRSGAGYEVLDEETIVMGLAAIKGMGDKAIEQVIENQPFSSFKDFLYRVDARVVNKSKLEALAKAGCFDLFKFTRKDIHDEGKKVRDKMKTFLRKKVKDGYQSGMAMEEFPITMPGREWSQQEKLRHEQEVLGELVSGDMTDLFPGFFTGYNATPLSRLKTLPNRHQIVVEVIAKAFLREFKIKAGRYKGQTMMKYLVEDVMGTETELTIWPDQYVTAKKLITIGRPVRAICQVSDFNGLKSLMLRELEKVYGI
jgi:DNA polymerase-3 subunit alpha